MPIVVSAQLNNFNWICGEGIKLVKKHLDVDKGDEVYWYVTDSGEVILSGRMIAEFSNLVTVSKVYRAPGHLTTMPRNIRALLGVGSGDPIELRLTRIDNIPIAIVRKAGSASRNIEIKISKDLLALLPKEIVSHLCIEEGDIVDATLAQDDIGNYVLLRKSLKSLLKSAGRRYDPQLTHEKLEDIADKMLFELIED